MKLTITVMMSLGLMGCLGGGSDSDSPVTQTPAPTPLPAPAPTPSPQPMHPKFQLVSDTLVSNSTNVAVSNFSVTYTFTNNVNLVSALLDLNSGAQDTTVKLTSVSGNEPIAIAVSGSNLTVTLKNPSTPLLPLTKYTLTIQSSLLDIYGQTLTSGNVTLSFTTAAGSYPGYINLIISQDNPAALAAEGLNVTEFTVSLGDKSALLLPQDVTPPPNAEYDMVVDQPILGTQTTPVIPLGAFPKTDFKYRYYYSLSSKTTYYLAVKACAPGSSADMQCSTFSPELPFPVQ